jgi:UDP-glucuronate 4-epimerase
MRALVTGCAGFVGSHLVESLLADGVSVLGIDSFLSNYEAAEKHRNLEVACDSDDFVLRVADLASADLRDVVEGCDVVFHLAAEPGVRTSWGERFDSYVRNNVLATQRLLEAMKEQPPTRFVYGSSSSIYGQAERLPTPESALPRPYSPYGVTKLAAEHLCQLYHGNHGVPTVMLRYFSVYGPRQRPDMAFHRFCRAAIEERPLSIFGAGDQIRDFTFVADVVRATRSAAQAPRAVGEVYNIGGGSQVALTHAIQLLEEFAGHPFAVERTEAQPGDIRATGADISRARADLDYEPSVRFEDGLRAEFEWMLARVRPLRRPKAAAADRSGPA